MDERFLGGTDLLLATDPGYDGIDEAEIGVTLRGDVKGVAKRFDFHLDFEGRESITGNSMKNQLYQVNAVARDLFGRLDLTVGRFATPGGFWLIADGAELTLHLSPVFFAKVYGGLRAFNGEMRESWIDSDPVALPLVGASVGLQSRIVQAWLTFSYAEDALEIHRGGGLPSALPEDRERAVVDEYFLDAQAVVSPSDRLFFSGGLSLGTRYDIQLDADEPYDPVTLGLAELGAIGVIGTAEWRPFAVLRLQYTFNYEHTRVYQSQLLTLKADGTPVEATDASFEDHTFYAEARVWRALRADAEYRLRFRANTDIEQHVTGGVRGDQLWKGFGAFANIGIDLNQLHEGLPNTKVHDRVIYGAGASYVRKWFDLRAGIQYTDGIGSGLLFSRATPSASGQAPTQLFPFVLETNQIAYVRAFGIFGRYFAGVDIEENLDDAQMRALGQAGVSL